MVIDMKMDTAHKNALESCIDRLKKDGNLQVWITFGIPDEDRLEIIKMAEETLEQGVFSF